MTDHVRVGEVGHDQIVLAAGDCRDERVADALRRHRRLQVVGGDLEARDELSILTGPRLLAATVEEVRYMGVLLGLGDVVLRPTGRTHRTRQRRNDLRSKDDLHRQVGLVGCHGREQDALRRRTAGCPVKPGEVGIRQSV